MRRQISRLIHLYVKHLAGWLAGWHFSFFQGHHAICLHRSSFITTKKGGQLPNNNRFSQKCPNVLLSADQIEQKLRKKNIIRIHLEYVAIWDEERSS